MTQIAFGLMSAGYRADTIDQLAESLLPARVIIHHDSHRYPGYHFNAANTHLVPNPVRTGWGTWGLVAGMLRMFEHALEHFHFDVLITVSPTCLPVRPLAELIDYLEGHPADAYTDLVMLDEDPEALSEYASRVFFPAGSIRQRAMLKMRNLAISSGHERIDRHGLNIPRPDRRDWRWRAGQHAARAALNGRLSRHPFGADLRPAMGAPWLAATRAVIEKIVEFGRDPRVLNHYGNCHLIDESFFATAIANMNCRVEPMLHFINDFDPAGHPMTLDAAGLVRARASGKFFARKFADDPENLVRIAALAAIDRDHARRRTRRAPATMSAMLEEITRQVDARTALRRSEPALANND